MEGGRVDQPVAAVTPDGRLPAADKGAPSDTIKALKFDVFYRMGFNDQEIVALSGAHALGRCHPDASGYSGPWTPTPTKLTTGYYNLLLSAPWTLKEWDGPMQFEDPSGKLMMLPSDIALLQVRSSNAAACGTQQPHTRALPHSTTTIPPTLFSPLQDKTWRKYVKMYAADQDLFFKDFTAAYTKLTELGTKNLKPVAL